MILKGPFQPKTFYDSVIFETVLFVVVNPFSLKKGEGTEGIFFLPMDIFGNAQLKSTSLLKAFLLEQSFQPRLVTTSDFIHYSSWYFLFSYASSVLPGV